MAITQYMYFDGEWHKVYNCIDEELSPSTSLQQKILELESRLDKLENRNITANNGNSNEKWEQIRKECSF